jgi:hypothetical protein
MAGVIRAEPAPPYLNWGTWGMQQVLEFGFAILKTQDNNFAATLELSCPSRSNVLPY